MHDEHEIAELINANFAEFEDIELLELLLGMSMAQEHCQGLSRICQSRFGSLPSLINSSPQALRRAGLPTQSILTIKLIQAIGQRIVDKTPETSAVDANHLFHSNN
jgi:DNA repair protein RadC